MIDATHLKAHHTACSLLKKRGVPRRIGRTKGGIASNLHAICDHDGRPLIMLLSEGQKSGYKGARHMVCALPGARYMLGDRGYNADWFCTALRDKDIEPCLPPKANCKRDSSYGKMLYKQRYKIEIMFGRLKDWRRISMRYDRCALIFFSSICIAETVIFYLNQ